MAIKLIVMDLDGTLLNTDKLISKGNREAIRKAQAKGVLTTIATGRMYLSAAFFAKQFEANAPLITCNGSMVKALDKEQPLFERVFPEDLLKELLTLSHERAWYVQWYSGTEIFAEDFRPEYFYAYRTSEGFKLLEVGDKYLQYAKDVNQVVVRNLHGEIPEILTEIKARFGDAILPQQNTGLTVDLTPPGVSKAVGIEAIMKAYGIQKDEVMACGDADNDLKMLAFAGTSVVPANGSADAKALATYHAPSCNEDAIKKAIEDLVL